MWKGGPGHELESRPDLRLAQVLMRAGSGTVFWTHAAFEALRELGCAGVLLLWLTLR